MFPPSQDTPLKGGFAPSGVCLGAQGLGGERANFRPPTAQGGGKRRRSGRRPDVFHLSIYDALPRFRFLYVLYSPCWPMRSIHFLSRYPVDFPNFARSFSSTSAILYSSYPALGQYGVPPERESAEETERRNDRRG